MRYAHLSPEYRETAVALLLNQNKSDRLVADGVVGEDSEPAQPVENMVRRGGIEPPTHGFSVQDDENE